MDFFLGTVKNCYPHLGQGIITYKDNGGDKDIPFFEVGFLKEGKKGDKVQFKLKECNVKGHNFQAYKITKMNEKNEKNKKNKKRKVKKKQLDSFGRNSFIR